LRPFTLTLLILGLHTCSTALSSTSIPFKALSAPDTVWTEVALKVLERSYRLVYPEQRRFSVGPEDDRFEGAKLVKKPGDFWLVYDLPVWCSAPQHDYAIDGFNEDGRYLRLTQRSGSLTRGHENVTVELYLVDLERTTYATITVRMFEQRWDTDGTGTDTKGHITIDSAEVTFAGAHVYITRGCTVDGRSVPCEDPGGAYRITPEALVLDTTISVARTDIVDHGTPLPLTAIDRAGFVRLPRLCPGDAGTRPALTQLDATARQRLLQDHAPHYANCILSYGWLLQEAPQTRITLLSDRDDDHDLLWLAYDDMGRLIGLDTLASEWGDGQLIRWECAYVDPYGNLRVEAVEEETLRDEVDTMAYRRDTLVYSIRGEATGLQDEQGEIRSHYRLTRRPEDLTQCWVEKHATNDQPPHLWMALRAVIPNDRIVFQHAIGDLNRDGAQDHVLVLTNETDDGPRDLLIAFTAQDRGSYVRYALLKDFLPARNSGGFHDPISEEGISGISIHEDTLVITQFVGSAWKWTSTDKYVHDGTRNAFYLVETGGRSFHAAGEEGMREEMSDLETLRKRQKLSPEQKVRHAELKELEEKATWRATRYALGQKPMAP
jgi:hypothetical protein